MWLKGSLTKSQVQLFLVYWSSVGGLVLVVLRALHSKCSSCIFDWIWRMDMPVLMHWYLLWRLQFNILARSIFSVAKSDHIWLRKWGHSLQLSQDHSSGCYNDSSQWKAVNSTERQKYLFGTIVFVLTNALSIKHLSWNETLTTSLFLGVTVPIGMHQHTLDINCKQLLYV